MSAFNTRLYQSQHLRQELKINPRLYQAMELLYMPLLDLQQHLKQELEENPFLEMSEPDVIEELSIDEEGREDRRDDEIDWEGILLDGFDVGGRRAEYEERDYFQATPVEQFDLRDHLMDQLRLLSLEERDLPLAEEVIGNIEDSGMLGCSLDEVLYGANRWMAEFREAARRGLEGMRPGPERDAELAEVARLFADYGPADAERLLEVVQGMEPAGVGARDLRECILIQLRRKGEDETLAYAVVADHYDAFIAHRWSDIARALGISPREVQDAADRIAVLDPKPGLQHSSDPDLFVVPDLIVEKIDGEYRVFANDTSLPRLRLSRSYREVAQDRSKFQGENRDFIASKLNSANWMIHAIEQRRQTMLRVMSFIVDRQRDFFERGVQYLKPLTLREVAEHVEMHESTISRVTNEKHVQTPRGVLPLKYFFSSGLSTANGEDISARGVRDKIRKLVDDEDARRPLTDQTIVELLSQDGVQIARRTVAKYRDQLSILPARMRKRV